MTSQYRQILNSELEAVGSLWIQRYGAPSPSIRAAGMNASVPRYRWAAAILKICEEHDCEPWAVIRRFPMRPPRAGWWPMLRYIRSNRRPLEVGETNFEAWRSSIAPATATDATLTSMLGSILKDVPGPPKNPTPAADGSLKKGKRDR